MKAGLTYTVFLLCVRRLAFALLLIYGRSSTLYGYINSLGLYLSYSRSPSSDSIF